MQPQPSRMEPNWSSYNEATKAEGSELMTHLIGTNYQDLSYELPLPSMPFLLDQAMDKYYCASKNNDACNNFFYSQEEPTSGYASYYLNEPNVALSSLNYSMLGDQCVSSFLCLVLNPSFLDSGIFNEEETSSDNLGPFSMSGSGQNDLHDYMLHPKRKCHALEDTTSSQNPKKKARAPVTVSKLTKKTLLKRSQKSSISGDDEESRNVTNEPCSCSYNSEADSHASEEQNGVANTSLSLKETPAPTPKARAGRGSATDPQSIYARKRRERINERIRILQNLVPNGTKVDISTMLEEAVQYVNFLQLQIKLLSSDELWMYAPIAYNAMNLGLDLQVS